MNVKHMVYALVACLIAAALEGAFAGKGIRRHFAEMRLPRYAPPLWGWAVIGILYYAMCFAVLYRLFGLTADREGRTVALLLTGGIMFVNALWNYFFFRTRDLRRAFLLASVYGVAAFVLFALLWRMDQLAAWYLVPYLCYLPYATLFGYAMWQMNPPAARPPGRL